MVFPPFDRRNDLHIRCGAKLQVDLRSAQMLDEAFILVTAGSVPYALRIEQSQRLPYALRSAGLTRMRRTAKTMPACVPIGAYVCIEREPGLIARNVQRHDAAALKPFNPLRRFETLLFAEVPQRAENQASLDACFVAQLLYRPLHRGNHALRAKPIEIVEKRRKPNLCIDHAILG